MWPRICEAILSVWLFVSPALLDGPPHVDLVARGAAVVMAVLSLMALAERFRRAYLGTFAVSLLIALYPFLSPPPASPMLQNLMITGLVIAMFAIMPPDAMRPPRAWRELDHE